MCDSVRKIQRNDASALILHTHYARRWPSISYAYGLFDANELVGVVTYGSPPSATLKVGVAGPAYAGHILELNRLVLKYNRKNEASRLVAASLKLLRQEKGNAIVVSFADTAQGHTGTVYQACNFGYYGLSAKRTDWRVRGKEHLHGQTIADEFRGVKNRAQAMRDKYGDDFYLQPRSRKHRYIYVIGEPKFVKEATRAIKYKKEGYPKHG